MEGNYMIDGDDGENCQSPKHDEANCPYCNPKQEVKVCTECFETFVGTDEEEVCKNCL